MLKVKITYPEADEEQRVLDMALDESARTIKAGVETGRRIRHAGRGEDDLHR